MTKQKETELIKCRCLNRHPETVRCELFKNNSFFDSRDLLQVKYEMIRQVHIEKCPIHSVANQFGFSRPSIYKALTDFNNFGLLGLARDKPGPRHPYKINEAVLQFIKVQKREKPDLKLHELVQQIKKKFGIAVHRRSIQRVLSKKKQ